MRRLMFSLLPLVLLIPAVVEEGECAEAMARAGAPVDATLVTAIDLSDSIMRHEEWLQFEGIALAVLDPEFLAAVAHGRHGRIGFAVFTWSSQDRRRMVVPWTLIDGPAAALSVATLLRQAPRPARFGGGDGEERSPPRLRVEHRTDVSAAIGFGASLFRSAPGLGGRPILNVIGNGVDNVAGGVRAARDAALAAGITINGVVLGDDPALAGYFRERVVGGAGSFVMRVVGPRAFADVMRAKFLRDLIASAVPPAGAAPT